MGGYIPQCTFGMQPCDVEGFGPGKAEVADEKVGVALVLTDVFHSYTTPCNVCTGWHGERGSVRDCQTLDKITEKNLDS